MAYCSSQLSIREHSHDYSRRVRPNAKALPHPAAAQWVPPHTRAFSNSSARRIGSVFSSLFAYLFDGLFNSLLDHIHGRIAQNSEHRD